MFAEDELEDYKPLFNDLGIDNENQEKRILEFLYTLGTITYNHLKRLEDE